MGWLGDQIFEKLFWVVVVETYEIMTNGATSFPENPCGCGDLNQ